MAERCIHQPACRDGCQYENRRLAAYRMNLAGVPWSQIPDPATGYRATCIHQPACRDNCEYENSRKRR